jgi:hypothetical protein
MWGFPVGDNIRQSERAVGTLDKLFVGKNTHGT